MNLAIILSAFQDDLPDPHLVWQACSSKGFDGLVACFRHAPSFASYPLSDVRSFEEQCEWISRVAAEKPLGARFILGPYDEVAAEAGSTIPHDAVWFAPGANQHVALVQTVVARDQNLLISINGLGTKAFDILMQVCARVQPTLCYVAGEGEQIAAVTQLAWLKARGYKTGLWACESASLLLAAALGADYVLVSWKHVHNNNGELGEIVPRLRRIADIAVGKGRRPVTVREIERMADMEVCLVAAQSISHGHILTEADVTVRVGRQRGLAPYLLPEVVNCVARYQIEEDEPLTFGMLWEKGRNG